MAAERRRPSSSSSSSSSNNAPPSRIRMWWRRQQRSSSPPQRRTRRLRFRPRCQRSRLRRGDGSGRHPTRSPTSAMRAACSAVRARTNHQKVLTKRRSSCGRFQMARLASAPRSTYGALGACSGRRRLVKTSQMIPTPTPEMRTRRTRARRAHLPPPPPRA